MVQRQQEHMLLGLQPQQRHAQQWSSLQITGTALPPAEQLFDLCSLCSGKSPCRSITGRHTGLRWMDHLHRLPPLQGKSGAQTLMPLHSLLQAPLHHLNIEISLKTLGAGDEIGCATWLQLVQEPQPLLGKGEGDLLRTLAASSGGTGISSSLPNASCTR